MNEEKRELHRTSLNDVAEFIGKNMDEYAQKLITWDHLTYDLLKLPKHHDELSRIGWVKNRPVWVQKINDHFTQYGYQCRLFVEGHDNGARLYIKNASNSEQMRRGTKKILNASKNAIKRAETLKEVCTPSERKHLEIYIEQSREAAFALMGRLSANPRIAKALGEIILRDE